MKTIISTPKAPQAIGPYSQAVVHNNLVYCSGQIALSPEDMSIIGTDAKTQCTQVMQNLGEVLKAAGTKWEHVLKCSIFLKSMDDFAVVNEIYGKKFPSNPPARETVAVKTLPKDVLVEISCIAHL